MTYIEDIYSFLSNQCKSKDVRVESLPETLSIPRSALYRYMKGTVKIPPEMENKMAAALNMDETERLRFRYLISISMCDPTLVASREVVSNIIFGHNIKQRKKNFPKKDMIFYSNDVYIRSIDKILKMLLETIEKASHCDIKIINCMHGGLINIVNDLVETSSCNYENTHIDHIIRFSSSDYKYNMEMLEKLMPLIEYAHYNVVYNETENDDSLALFSDVILVELSNDEGDSEFEFLSFVDGTYSECYHSNDTYFAKMMKSHFDACMARQTQALSIQEKTNAIELNDTIIELNSKYGCYIIKPNMCYDLISFEVYKEMIEENEGGWVAEMIKGYYHDIAAFNTAMYPLDTLKEVISSTFSRRIDSSFFKKRCDVTCISGLELLAKTGRITDHLEGLPDFNKKQRKQIFEYVLKRHLDPNDVYSIIICRDDIMLNGNTIVVYDGHCIYIEFDPNKYQKGYINTLMMKNRMLEQSILDYIENALKPPVVLSQEETVGFLKKLIFEL